MNLAKLTCIAGGLLLSSASLAADLSFQGTFERDDDVQLLSFSVLADSTVTLRSLGYAGGINAAGQTILRGGFDTMLSLFDDSGTQLARNDDGSNVIDAGTGQSLDAYWETFLSTGNYQVSIMQYNNSAIGPTLADGFLRTGEGNFTAGFGCGANAFCDVSGVSPFDQRDGHWAFDISASPVSRVSAIPEPETYAMLMAGLGLLAFATRRPCRFFAGNVLHRTEPVGT